MTLPAMHECKVDRRAGLRSLRFSGGDLNAPTDAVLVQAGGGSLTASNAHG